MVPEFMIFCSKHVWIRQRHGCIPFYCSCYYWHCWAFVAVAVGCHENAIYVVLCP